MLLFPDTHLHSTTVSCFLNAKGPVIHLFNLFIFSNTFENLLSLTRNIYHVYGTVMSTFVAERAFGNAYAENISVGLDRRNLTAIP